MKKSLRILFDANPLATQKTGVGHYIKRLTESLAREYPNVKLVGYYYNFLGRKKTIALPPLPNLTYRQILWMPGPLVNLLRRWHILLPVELLTFKRADFILYPNYLGLRTLFRTPSANVVHDLSYIDLPDYVASKNLEDLKRYLPAQLKRSSFLITVSDFTKQRMCDEFGTDPATILVTPIPPEPPNVEPKRDEPILRHLGITGKYILTIGTIEPRKNLPNMLEAYVRLPESLQSEYTFIVVGKVGWNCERELAVLKQLAAEGKRVRHIGYVDDVQREVLDRNATLFTSASWYEGFGMPALEAMIVKTPCAISDIAIFHEVAGDSALYFNQDDPASIAATWENILIHPEIQRRFAEAGYAHTQDYDWGTVATSLYERIASVVE